MIVSLQKLTNFYTAAELKIIKEIKIKALELISFTTPYKSIEKIELDFQTKTILFVITDLGAEYEVKVN